MAQHHVRWPRTAIAETNERRFSTLSSNVNVYDFYYYCYYSQIGENSSVTAALV